MDPVFLALFRSHASPDIRLSQRFSCHQNSNLDDPGRDR